MKKFVFYFLLCSMLTIPSCADDFDVATKSQKSVDKVQNYGHIADMAREIFYELQDGARSGEPAVENITPWLTRDIFPNEYNLSRSGLKTLPDTLLYIVNFENKAGCVLISDNEEYQGPVAIIPKQNISPKERVSDNPGFELYLELYSEALINGGLNDLKIDKDSVLIDSMVPSAKNWVTIEQNGPALIQEWGQEDPFNLYCFTAEGERAVAGCIPVAMGQLLTLHQKPDSINGYKIDWQDTKVDFPETSKQKDTIARLIHELGILCNAVYGLDETWVDLKKITSTLKELGYYYYKTDFYQTDARLKSQKLKDLIIDLGPALVFGSPKIEDGERIRGHEWVIDGFRAQVNPLKDVPRILFHCNWGYYGNMNGYFLANAFDPNKTNEEDKMLTHNLQFTFILTPKTRQY